MSEEPDWSKLQSLSQSDQLKELLKGEAEDRPPKFYDHIPKQVDIQFHGWAIVLLDNGTWYWLDTSGG